jgi:hypothetical protein
MTYIELYQPIRKKKTAASVEFLLSSSPPGLYRLRLLLHRKSDDHNDKCQQSNQLIDGHGQKPPSSRMALARATHLPLPLNALRLPHYHLMRASPRFMTDTTKKPAPVYKKREAGFISLALKMRHWYRDERFARAVGAQPVVPSVPFMNIASD